MKAVQIAAPQKMAVVEIEKPELKAGEILVKITSVRDNKLYLKAL